ncbi:MAG: peptide chain release factor N(5)-glutamine methyltransferase [bacterium]
MQIKYCDLKKSSPLPAEKFDFLAGESLNFSREKLFMISSSLELSANQIKKIKKNQALALAGTPPEYIFKKAYFAGNKFYVDENVLIPRPETEILIQEAIGFLNKATERLSSRVLAKRSHLKDCRGHHQVCVPPANRAMTDKISILDLGTGCGCIAITLKKLFPKADLTASDVLNNALKIAKKNAKNHKVQIEFIQSDLFQEINGQYDLILANLPYVDEKDALVSKLADPEIALDGGKDGFELIEKFLLKLPNHLDQNGMAVLEIGYNQEKLIKKCTKNIGLKCKIKNDLNNFARIALISKK